KSFSKAESTGIISATGGAPSPSDRIQILSQPRRSSASARSVHSVPEMTTTPISQSHSHWQSQYGYAHGTNMASPHVEHPPNNWNAHPSAHASHPTVSISVPDSSLHAVEPVSYPSPYSMDNNARSMSYPLENATDADGGLHHSHFEPIPSSGGVPATHERSHECTAPHEQFPTRAHLSQSRAPRLCSSGQSFWRDDQQPQMMNEQGQMMYHMQPPMKVEH
ncbi:hypothetical protein DM02DRAFT_686108, partial [Periconia macrospinosa]